MNLSNNVSLSIFRLFNFFQLYINHLINSSLMSPTKLSGTGSLTSLFCGAMRIKFLLCIAVMSWALTPGFH